MAVHAEIIIKLVETNWKGEYEHHSQVVNGLTSIFTHFLMEMMCSMVSTSYIKAQILVYTCIVVLIAIAIKAYYHEGSCVSATSCALCECCTTAPQMVCML